MVSGSQTSHASFDVFDTLLTRVVGEPRDVFLFLGARLRQLGLIECSAEVFAHQRILAEARANAIAGCHPTLGQIYSEWLHGMNHSELAPERFAAEELALEERFLIAVPGALELVQLARQEGCGIVFVTDTNMPSSFIVSVLEKHGFYRPGDRIFASCEVRVDKARGLMFPYVVNALKVRPAALRHHGNSAVADVRNAKLSGWQTRHRQEANLNRYEQALVADTFATGGLSSLFAGSSRLARLSQPVGDEREKTIASVAAGVMAPMLVAWMIWLLRRATRDGIRRLYFVSRDGEVLLEIAKRLLPLVEGRMELRYLYVGRQSLVLAGSPEAALRDLIRAPTTRLVDVAESLGLTEAQLQQALPQHMRGPGAWNRALSADDRGQLQTALNQIRELLVRASNSAREILTDYLEQEGWAIQEPLAVVDVGWRASMAGTLGDALRDSRVRMPDKFYYFGLGSDAHQVAGDAMVPRLDAWFYDDASRRGHLPYFIATSSLVEMFCAGSHGSVMGYERAPEGIQPRLRSPVSPMQQWGLPLMRSATVSFVEQLMSALPEEREAGLIDADLRHSIHRIMELFWLRPTRTEVKYWGTYPVQANFTNTIVLPLAERISVPRVLRALSRGSFRFRSNHAWPRGTELRSPFAVRQLLKGIAALRGGSTRFRRRLTWFRARLGLPPG
jgi:FMN phosphatase YigB (HAD superfamily)